MESHTLIQLRKNGAVLPGSTQVVASHDAHWSIWDETDNLKIVLEELAKAIAAKYGIGDYKYTDALAALKKIGWGSDKSTLRKAAVDITGGPSFDEVEIIFKAWSEDDLKGSTCKTATAPTQARFMGETLTTHNYASRHIISVANQADTQYLFQFGAQDDGWWQDIAIFSDIQINYHRGALRPLGNAPDHNSPDVPVTTEVANNYAHFNSIMASLGIDLGNPGANSPNEDVHRIWAERSRIPQIIDEMVRKINVLAQEHDIFANAYALLSCEIGKILQRGQPLGEQAALIHCNWAKNKIQAENSITGVRNELLRKMYNAFEMPSSQNQPTLVRLAEDVSAQVDQRISAMAAEMYSARTRLKTYAGRLHMERETAFPNAARLTIGESEVDIAMPQARLDYVILRPIIIRQ